MNKQMELDFVSAMTIIAEIEKSPRKGDLKFLKLALGEKTFKKMAAAGYIHFGFYIENEEIVETYSTTQTYKEWDDLIKNIPKATIKTKIKYISNFCF